MEISVEQRSILAENRKRGWAEVDATCPPHIAKRIIEFRCKAMDIPVPSNDDADTLADARMRALLS
jgi:hypothetical protein